MWVYSLDQSISGDNLNFNYPVFWPDLDPVTLGDLSQGEGDGMSSGLNEQGQFALGVSVSPSVLLSVHLPTNFACTVPIHGTYLLCKYFVAI